MHNTTSKLRTVVAGLIAALTLAIAMPAVAGAQSPTRDQYKDPVVKVQTATGANDQGSGLSEPVGPLPFTGFDVIAMLGVALAVTGLGLALQRAVATRPSGD